MSHHLSGPNLRSPDGDARLDLTDVFTFLSPRDKGRTVLIMDVNPYAPKQASEFHPDAVYRVNVDTDRDNKADLAFSYVFTRPKNGQQTCNVHLASGADAQRPEAVGDLIIGEAPVSFGPDPQIAKSGPFTFFAGMRSDPFFADLEGILNDFKWTGVDSMADENVFGIVLELPNEVLGSAPEIGVWARVSLYRAGKLESMDRGAHPSLTAYFNAEDVKAAYNRGEPADDRATYTKAWSQVLQHTGGYTAQQAEAALAQVLPDILWYDRSKPAGYPNGRRLDDDVTSARLSFLTNGKIKSDNIPPHKDLLPDFPYLGTPHEVHAKAR